MFLCRGGQGPPVTLPKQGLEVGPLPTVEFSFPAQTRTFPELYVALDVFALGRSSISLLSLDGDPV